MKVALVGYGYWGPNLARNLHELPNAEFAACCDLDPARLASVRGLYPRTRVTTRVEELLEDATIEGLVVATPPGSHFALAKTALRAGKHVLVEKPLTMRSEEAEELVDLARAQGRILMVGHTYEYNPGILKVKELVDHGQLGEVFYAYSTRVNLGRVQQDLNVLWSIAPHDISILVFLLGAMPVEVSARGAAYLRSGIEDVVFINLTFPSGATAHIHASWLDPSKVRRTTVVGSSKMAVFDDLESEGKVKIYDKGIFRARDDKAFGEFQYRLHSGDIHIPKIELTEPLRNECSHFVECILQGKTPRTDGENGLRVVRVLEAAQRSMEKKGMPLEVEP